MGIEKLEIKNFRCLKTVVVDSPKEALAKILNVLITRIQTSAQKSKVTGFSSSLRGCLRSPPNPPILGGIHFKVPQFCRSFSEEIEGAYTDFSDILLEDEDINFACKSLHIFSRFRDKKSVQSLSATTHHLRHLGEHYRQPAR